MRTESIHYFTEKNMLIETGTKKNIALLLLVLANTPKTASLAIERVTDHRHPAVSIAIKYLVTGAGLKSG